jgi:hypothetical protein
MKLTQFPAILIALSLHLYCQEPNSIKPLTLSGYVTDCHANPVPKATVGLHEGGNTVTTDSGGFIIFNFPDKVKVGFPVNLYVKDWVVADPHMGGIGRLTMPSPDAEQLGVTVGKKGDRCLILPSGIEIIVGLRVFYFDSSGADTNTGRLSGDPASNSAFSENSRGASLNRCCFRKASLSLSVFPSQAAPTDNGRFTPTTSGSHFCVHAARIWDFH